MAAELAYERIIFSPEEMDELAATLAPLLRAGDVVLLNGDLGAGKTRFVQGVGHALGVDAPVTSPTFTIQTTYDEGFLPLNHFDLYRLESAEDLDDIGYWETLEGDGVSFVEWGDKFPDDAPEDFVELTLTVGDDGARTITACARGERAHNLLSQWGSAEEAGWRDVA